MHRNEVFIKVIRTERGTSHPPATPTPPILGFRGISRYVCVV